MLNPTRTHKAQPKLSSIILPFYKEKKLWFLVFNQCGTFV
ncbi:hypothetical protein BVRB_8g201600 [Beta vulgaris subsp. vulgaris]|uniref:Uncharacterized protein n=1 Tax=Beta vulgaris subsp. vulgaris TaxID=3555 RepID=A0A0J8E0G9_BETVV|nr:hypothetical protein BVRB_8g201600 [Beta vulgaris subsp. vulgaris]